jgi:hypothetical protein
LPSKAFVTISTLQDKVCGVGGGGEQWRGNKVQLWSRLQVRHGLVHDNLSSAGQEDAGHGCVGLEVHVSARQAAARAFKSLGSTCCVWSAFMHQHQGQWLVTRSLRSMQAPQGLQPLLRYESPCILF